MLLKDLSREQRDNICDYLMKKYRSNDENHRWLDVLKACDNCPFSAGIECIIDFNERELPKYLEEIINEI